METGISTDVIHSFLTEVGRRCEQPGRLYVLGGSALSLLGSARPTLDLDYFGNDMQKNDLQTIIDQVATEMQIEVEAVPLDEFIPIPQEASERHRFVARYGLLDVYIFDPYSISLSKLDRGFDADIEDVVFLLRNGTIGLDDLENAVKQALSNAHGFDLDPSSIRRHLDIVRNQHTRA